MIVFLRLSSLPTVTLPQKSLYIAYKDLLVCNRFAPFVPWMPEKFLTLVEFPKLSDTNHRAT